MRFVAGFSGGNNYDGELVAVRSETWDPEDLAPGSRQKAPAEAGASLPIVGA